MGIKGYFGFTVLTLNKKLKLRKSSTIFRWIYTGIFCISQHVPSKLKFLMQQFQIPGANSSA